MDLKICINYVKLMCRSVFMHALTSLDNHIFEAVVLAASWMGTMILGERPVL